MVELFLAVGLIAAPNQKASVSVEPGEPCFASTLLTRKDVVLQRALQTELRGDPMNALLQQGSLGVALVDLTHAPHLYYAGINDDTMLYAASLPKIGILLSVIARVDDGTIEWTPHFEWRLTKMITISNNAFASWGADIVGLEGIAALMRDPRYCFYEQPAGGLWVGRPYRKGGPSYRDPIHNISHGATARQVARFYALLDEGKLVSHTWSARMRKMMAPPEHAHKFVAGLTGRVGVQFLARKSGTWRTFHADSALIRHHAKKYILVALADHPDGERALRRLARVVDDLIIEGEHRWWR